MIRIRLDVFGYRISLRLAGPPAPEPAPGPEQVANTTAEVDFGFRPEGITARTDTT